MTQGSRYAEAEIAARGNGREGKQYSEGGVRARRVQGDFARDRTSRSRSSRQRLAAKPERMENEVALLREEPAIKDAR